MLTRRAAWPLLAFVLAAGALACAQATPDRWDWQPGLAFRQPWRWWTASFVHWSAAHLWMNLLASLLVAWLGVRARLGPAHAVDWALAWPIGTLGLLVQPALQHFGGLSGTLHAGVAIAACALCRRPGRERRLGWCLMLGLGLKLCTERPWAGALQPWPEAELWLAPMSHVMGVAAGLGVAGLRAAWDGWRGSRLAASATSPDRRSST